MPTKPKKSAKAPKKETPVETAEERVPDVEETVGMPDISEGETLVNQIDPEKPNPMASRKMAGVEPAKGDKFEDLPALLRHQQYFESPDGRVYVGPADQPSIPDPLDPKRDINPMRGGSHIRRA